MSEDEITTISVKRKTASRFSILQRQFKLRSQDEFLSMLIDGLVKGGWSILDLTTFANEGKLLPEIQSGKIPYQEIVDRIARLEKEFMDKGKVQSKGIPVKGEVKKP